MKNRKVMVSKRTWPRGSGYPFISEVIGTGIFHGWGHAYEEFESGPGNYTIALVEMSDGSVLTPNPHEIMFVNTDIEGL